MYVSWLTIVLWHLLFSPQTQGHLGPDSRDNLHTVSKGITLAAEVVGRTHNRPALQLTLTNRNPYAVLVETGVIVGKVYPVANMTFSLALEDGTKRKLLCDGCGPAYIAGVLAPYSVTLAPGQQWQEQIPMSLFVVVSVRGEWNRLDTLHMHSGVLTAGLVVNEPLTSARGAQQTFLFRGAVFTKIAFPDFSAQERAYLRDRRNQ